MRQPDLDALLHHHRLGDLRSTVNLMALFCRECHPVDLRLAEVMAEILRNAGLNVMADRAARSLSIRNKIDIETLDRGSREKAYQSLAGSTGLSIHHLRKIYHGESAGTPLACFVENPLCTTPEQLAAAQKYISKLRSQLLANSNRPREKRRSLGLSGWGEVGRSILHEEIYDDVENLYRQTGSYTAAYRRLEPIFGESAANIKKIHQRLRAERRNALETAARAAGDGIRPADMNLEKRDKNKP